MTYNLIYVLFESQSYLDLFKGEGPLPCQKANVRCRINDIDPVLAKTRTQSFVSKDFLKCYKMNIRDTFKSRLFCVIMLLLCCLLIGSE